jgi:carbon storage regulator
MLELTRKLGESIVIDDEIVVTVTAVQGGRVKLSLEAPKNRRIMRGEIAGGAQSPSPARDEATWTRTGTDGARSPVVTVPTSAK